MRRRLSEVCVAYNYISYSLADCRHQYFLFHFLFLFLRLTHPRLYYFQSFFRSEVSYQEVRKMEDSIEDSKKRDVECVSRVRLSAFRVLLTYPYRINKVEEDKTIRMSPGLAYLKMDKGGRYNVKNWTFIYMGVNRFSHQNRDHMSSDLLTRKAAARVLIDPGVRRSSTFLKAGVVYR
jgi:hypothetical protein